jgi:hypothetical protein
MRVRLQSAGSFVSGSSILYLFFFLNSGRPSAKRQQTTTASKCQHSTFPHIHELPKAQKSGMPLPNRNSSVSRCSEAIRPCGSLTQPSQSAAVLPKSSGTKQPLPSHNQQLEHMLDTSMTLRRQDHKITECSNKKTKTCNTCKKALKSNSHSRVTTSNTSICSKPV